MLDTGRTNHLLHEIAPGEVVGGRGLHHLAVAHHGHDIAHFENLGKEVGHQHHGHAIGGQGPQDLIQALCFGNGEARPRLVKDHQPGIPGDGPQDLHFLAVRLGQ